MCLSTDYPRERGSRYYKCDYKRDHDVHHELCLCVSDWYTCESDLSSFAYMAQDVFGLLCSYGIPSE